MVKVAGTQRPERVLGSAQFPGQPGQGPGLQSRWYGEHLGGKTRRDVGYRVDDRQRGLSAGQFRLEDGPGDHWVADEWITHDQGHVGLGQFLGCRCLDGTPEPAQECFVAGGQEDRPRGPVQALLGEETGGNDVFSGEVAIDQKGHTGWLPHALEQGRKFSRRLWQRRGPFGPAGAEHGKIPTLGMTGEFTGDVPAATETP